MFINGTVQVESQSCKLPKLTLVLDEKAMMPLCGVRPGVQHEFQTIIWRAQVEGHLCVTPPHDPSTTSIQNGVTIVDSKEIIADIISAWSHLTIPDMHKADYKLDKSKLYRCRSGGVTKVSEQFVFCK